MSEDKYETMLLNTIKNCDDIIKKAKRKIIRLKVRDCSHPEWSDTNLRTIETTQEMIVNMNTKVNTVWDCLNKYKSVLVDKEFYSDIKTKES